MKTLFFALWVILWFAALAMATIQRDNTSSGDERRPSWEEPTITKKPLFVNRHNGTPRESIWEYRRNRKANLAAAAASANVTTAKRGPNQEDIPTRPIGWMSKSEGRAIGLTEAFSRVNDDDTEDIAPQTRPVLRERKEDPQERMATRAIASRSRSGPNASGLTGAYARNYDAESFKTYTRPTVAKKDEPVSDSRIPKIGTSLPESVLESLSPSQFDRPAFPSNGREDRALSAPTTEYESEDTGAVRDTSPSPGPRDTRWGGKISKQESESDSSNHSSVPVENDSLDYFERRRRELEKNMVKDDAYFEMKRAKRVRDRAYTEKSLKSTTPLFVGRFGSSKLMGTVKAVEGKTSESSVDEREPPIMIPSTWGSRARKNREWMQKILSPDTSLELKDPLEESEVMKRPATASNVMSPSVGDGSLTQEITPPSSRPASAQPMNASPEKSQIWDADLDFTARSVQISTSPQIRVRSASKLDDIRLREMQNLTARAVATNRLEEIRERNSEERSLIPAIEELHEKTFLEEEGLPIPNTPITVFGKNDWDDFVKRKNITLSASTQGQDHRDLLRRLSRSLSSSPKESDPTDVLGGGELGHEKAGVSDLVKSSGQGWEKLERPNLSIPLSSPGMGKPHLSDLEKNSDMTKSSEEKPTPSHTMQGSEPTDDPEERIAAEARLFDLQDKSEKGSIRTASPAEDLGETPRPKLDPLLLPTPRVTGAYIETPLTAKTRSRSPRPRSRQYRPSSRFRDSRPSLVNATTPLVNTANHVSAIDDLRRIQLESNVEDSTLDNLDFLEVAPPEEVVIKIEPILDLENNDQGLPLSQKEIDRRVEEITLERMNKSLKATTTSIRDARKGIERLEEQVSSSFPNFTQARPTIEPVDAPMYININVNIPVPRLWISNPQTKAGVKCGWKFTWLGLLLLSFAFWYLLESVTCAKFCHPTNSRVNTWQPSDPFFPWALPTKLDQWTGEVVSASFGGLADLFGIKGNWDWSFGIPDLPSNYKGGPIGASDWWLGRDGPVGVKHEGTANTFGDDEMI